MINHIRTLLLNKNEAEAGLTSGLSYAEYIDESFTPTKLDLDLSKLQSEIFINKTSLEDRLKILRALMSILHTSDLLSYTLYHDKRITYAIDQVDFTTFDIMKSITNVDSCLLNPQILTKLFKYTKSNTFMNDMYNIYISNSPKIVQHGAILLAFAINNYILSGKS